MNVADLCRENDISVAAAEKALANLQAKGLVTGHVPGNLHSEITLTADTASITKGSTMQLKISKKMQSLLEFSMPLNGALIKVNIGNEIEAGRADKTGAVTIEAGDDDIAYLRDLAGARVPELDKLLAAATSKEEQKPHFGEHSAWRALMRQIDPVAA